MGIRSSYWRTRLALTGRDSVETLTAMEGFFQGGANWTQGVYHRSNGQKCLVGAADHLRASSVDSRQILAGAGHCRKDRWHRHAHRKL